MAVYDGFFDAVLDDETEEYDRAYESGDFTGYFEKIIGSGVCVHGNENSFKVRLENGKAVVSPGYLFIQGYWCKNDADYSIDLPGTGNYAIAAHLNLGQRMIELKAQSVAQAYPDSLVLAIVSPSSAEDTRHNTDICGVIDTAGALSSKVEWALSYIDTEIESKLAQVEQDIAAQSAKLDLKIAEVQAVADSIVPPPIGSIKFSASQNVGAEWLKCDGSFVNEAQYPELVESLGKLIPSGDKFQLISSGEIGPQISNGVIYGGKMWVYSYSIKKLYGVDLAGTADIKEIAVTSEDENFNNFIPPSNTSPIVLSIVPHVAGVGARLFLAQEISKGDIYEYPAMAAHLAMFQAEFAGNESGLSLSYTFQSIQSTHPGGDSQDTRYAYSDPNYSVPYVVSKSISGAETYFFSCGQKSVNTRFSEPSTIYLNYGYVSWSSNDNAKINDVYRGVYGSQRIVFSKKSGQEMVAVSPKDTANTFTISSFPSGTFSGKVQTNQNLSFRPTPLPINVVGQNKILIAYDKNMFLYFSSDSNSAANVAPNVFLPSAARIFPDAASYLWGKDIYLIFVGTGIIFSRTLEANSFGYLDTTSVLGTITQFGYLDYSQDEGTLYLLGQDTTNTVKVAKIVLNTLYDYANDGAWLPMIASDGVPAYIKAKEAET